MSESTGDLWMVSYDVDGRDRSTAARVCQLVFGRKNGTTEGGIAKAYDQPGFVHRPGVVWVGQSVLILPRQDALELRRRLEAMGVSVGMGHLAIDGASLAVFKHRGRRSAGRRAV